MIESKQGSVALRQGTKLPIWFSSAMSAMDLPRGSIGDIGHIAIQELYKSYIGYSWYIGYIGISRGVYGYM